MHDPADPAKWMTIPRPRFQGPSSGKAAWVEYALAIAGANHGLRRLIDEQSAAIRTLKGEVELLKRQIAERRPKGGRLPLREDKVARIEEEIERGGTDRGIAGRYKVSHMTVFRIRKRMQQRRLAAPP
jgi:hypothetical protein